MPGSVSGRTCRASCGSARTCRQSGLASLLACHPSCVPFLLYRSCLLSVDVALQLLLLYPSPLCICRSSIEPCPSARFRARPLGAPSPSPIPLLQGGAGPASGSAAARPGAAGRPPRPGRSPGARTARVAPHRDVGCRDAGSLDLLLRSSSQRAFLVKASGVVVRLFQESARLWVQSSGTSNFQQSNSQESNSLCTRGAEESCTCGSERAR